MEEKNPYDLAKQIQEHEKVDNVRVSLNTIEVIEYLDNRNTPTRDNMDKEILEHVKQVLEDTLFIPEEGEYLDQTSEKHNTLGGRSHNTVKSNQPHAQEQLIRRYIK